jgi:hypothetical protein
MGRRRAKKQTPFPSEGGGVMTVLYCCATHERERERARGRGGRRLKRTAFAYREVIQTTSLLGQSDFDDFRITDVLTGT